MAIELECTVRVESLEAIREQLLAAGAKYIGRVLEDNRLFDRSDGALRAGDCGLRVRSVRVMEGPDQASTLTYKGPRTDSAFKSRDEIEVEIGDTAAMAGILRALGYSESVVYEKRRESWMLGACRIELDELPELGVFAEVEGPTEAAIRGVLETLGLVRSEDLEQSYAAMVAKHGETSGSRPIMLRFEHSQQRGKQL
ncbi:MAG: class IV adenylate cyclase [Phycisphaerae bacterium]|nr:class IV adenylate cyclase [Phycisphaerae bacterium]